MKGSPLIAGEAGGPLVTLTAPICFWGGLDPATGAICDPKHPQFGADLTGRIVAIPAIIGSSSSSQFLLEAMYRGTAPAAILLAEPEAIIATAAAVGREMGYGTLPILHCPAPDLPDGTFVRVGPNGSVAPVSPKDSAK